MKAVHFGAGNIGRGFIGAVLSENGYKVCFIDVNTDMVNKLKKQKSYTVELIDEEHTRFKIDNITALNSMTEEEEVINQIINADIITTSVGANNLEKIANILTNGLLKRIENNKSPIDIIANENAINASNQLKSEVAKIVTPEEMKEILNYASFVNSAIDRQSLSKEVDGEEIALVEPYYEWVINENEILNHNLPKLKGVTYVSDMNPYIERKLYIVNAGHASAAYVGKLMGLETIQEALADKMICNFIQETMKENARYLVREYDMLEKELHSFIEKTLERHGSPNIKDSMLRVGRSPIRKLGYNERIIAPLRKLSERKLPTNHGVKVVAAILLYHDETDAEARELQKSIAENGIKDTIRKYTNLEDTKIIDDIEENYKELLSNKAAIFI